MQRIRRLAASSTDNGKAHCPALIGRSDLIALEISMPMHLALKLRVLSDPPCLFISAKLRFRFVLDPLEGGGLAALDLATGKVIGG
jgi:hypothetical protein